MYIVALFIVMAILLEAVMTVLNSILATIGLGETIKKLPHAFSQHQESTTSFVTYHAEGTLTSSNIHSWGALLGDILSSNTTSAQYQDAFEYTTTEESAEQCGMQLDMYVHPTGTKLGMSTLCIFLIKDWQYIDIMARKYGTRAFWYGISSDGHQDETFDGFLISSRSTTESGYVDFVMLSLVCFFLDGYALHEGSGALHTIPRHQGRWGAIKSTSHEEKWGARVPSNEHESPLLGSEFNECFALTWSRDTATFAGIFNRILRALETLQLQRGVLDPLSQLCTWFFICRVTFADCELVLLCLKTRPTKNGNFSFMSCYVYMHNHFLRSSAITIGVHNTQPVRYSSIGNCKNCQCQITTIAILANSKIGHIHLPHIRSNDNSYYNSLIEYNAIIINNILIDYLFDNGDGEQLLPNHGERSACEYPYDISPTICNTCIMYSSTHHPYSSTINCNISLTFDIDEDVFDSNTRLRKEEPVSPLVREIVRLSTDVQRHFINNIEHPKYTHISTIKYSIDSSVNINDGEIMFGIIYPRREGRMLNGIEGCIVLNTSSDMVIHNIHLSVNEPVGFSVQAIIHRTANKLYRTLIGSNTSGISIRAFDVGNIMHRGYMEHIAYERTYSMNNHVTNNNTDGTIPSNDTFQDGEHNMPIHHAVNNNTLTSYVRSDLGILLVSFVTNDYNTHWLVTCTDGEHITMPIDGNDNTCKLLSMKEIQDDNTHAECDTAQLIVEFENTTMYNISPTRWDGRGVSADRFKVQSEYASNLDELERYL